jgi:uncharacterized protein YukE
MRSVTIGARTIAFFALAAAPLAPAGAQEVLHAPDAIRSCLCQEQAVSTLSDEVLQRNRAYEEQRKMVEDLDNKVRTQRPEVNVSNAADVDAFRQLLDQRDKAADTFAGDTTRNYSDAVGRYNQAVNSFNNGCAGKAYDPEVLAEVRKLTCPKP